ncbi:hypothetical protein SAMN05892883_4369 [Jatrophihabitans sp. GAS493]|nr:hypothetical protein SAMN05892883_4369 [Jatrophihabitans sp. GAS493]
MIAAEPATALLQQATAHLFAYHPVLADAVVSAASAAPTGSTDNSGDGEDHKAGPWGLGIVLILCIACYFLFRSMSRHLRTVREEFPGDPADGPVPQTLPIRPDAPSAPTAATTAVPQASPAAGASAEARGPVTPSGSG